jgi:hypothetical protein
MELPTLILSRPSIPKGPINSKQFSSKLENSTNLKVSIKTCNEIESVARQLVKSIQSAIYECSYPPNQKCHSKLKSFILPPNINILIAEKRRTHSRWQRSRLPSDKSAFNNLSKTIKKLIQKYKNDLFDTKFKSLNTQDGLLWKSTKNMLKLKEFSCPIKKANESLALSDLDKANLFGEHLSLILELCHDYIILL